MVPKGRLRFHFFLLNLLSPDSISMKKTPRFLLCMNPLVDHSNQYILCTRPQKVLFELINTDSGNFNLEIYEIYEGSNNEASTALLDAKSWYIAFLASGRKGLP